MYSKGFSSTLRLASASRSHTVDRLMFVSARAASFDWGRVRPKLSVEIKAIDNLSSANQTEIQNQLFLENFFDLLSTRTNITKTTVFSVNMGTSNSRCVPSSSPPPPHLTGCRSVQLKPNTVCACVELNAHTSSSHHQQFLNNYSHNPPTTWLLCSASPQITSTTTSNGGASVSCHQQASSVTYCGCHPTSIKVPFWQTAAVNGDSTSGWDNSAQHVSNSGLIHHTFAQPSPFGSKLATFGKSLLMMNGHGNDNLNSAVQKRAMHSNSLRGMDLLREPNYNKDLAYTPKERDQFGIKGLIPPAVRSQELQARIAIQQFRQLDGSLAKYMYMRDLQDYNKRLFYRLLCEYVEELMPIVYTPVVGEACIKYSELYKRPRGLFITKHDRGHVYDILGNWPEKDIKAIVVTDGERILGLGDLGANGMGIPVGKLALYSALAGIPPHSTLPVTLDVGTNNEQLIDSETYIGLKEKRERGKLYDELVEEFMQAVVKKWGRSCLIQFEDFGNSNAFKLLDKYRNNYCTFNDDIQGTASVAVAGIMAACRRLKQKISQQRILFMGAGGAALGISDLLVMAMEQEGMSTNDARNNIYLIDSKGLVSLERENEQDPHKLMYAKSLPLSKDLGQIVDMVKPTCLVGVCAQPGVFTETVLNKMAQHNSNPIIFPLSNPTSKAECTAEQAYTYTEGRAIFASGSPFDIFKYKDQTFIPGQGNNSYIFPGVALAVMSCSVPTIPEEVFLVAAKALADQVTAHDLAEGRVYPPLKKIQEVSIKIAAKVAQYLFVQGLASVRPEPDDKELFIRQHQYNYSYDNE